MGQVDETYGILLNVNTNGFVVLSRDILQIGLFASSVLLAQHSTHSSGCQRHVVLRLPAIMLKTLAHCVLC